MKLKSKPGPRPEEINALIVHMRAQGMLRKDIVRALAESAGIGERYVERLLAGPETKNYKPCKYAFWRLWVMDHGTEEMQRRVG